MIEEDETKVFEQYHYLVKSVVSGMLKTMTAQADTGVMMNSGRIGLLKAISGYKPELGASFETYARRKIRGTVLDELRREDFLPRGARQRSGFTYTAVELDACPVDDMAVQLPDDSVPHPIEIMEVAERATLLDQILSCLSLRKRRAVVGYYIQDLKMREIAKELNVTESRIVQAVKEALRECRAFYERSVACLVFACTLLAGWCDGPDLRQDVWLSNGVVFASADIPACHYAIWQRKVLPSTNWFEADSRDYEFFTRRVVFSEPLHPFVPFFRVHVIYVPWCASLNLVAMP